MPAIAARSGQNIRRTCSLVNEIPTAASKTPPTYGSGKSVQTATPSHMKNSKLYKTELCRTWMDCGRCNYGEKCQYAHGEQERRPVSRHPKYKTEFCQPFHQVGYCPYGPRCNFIHNEEQPPPSLQTRRNLNNCNGKSKVTSGICSNNGITGTTATTTTTTLTFGVWRPYCSSTGESPVPSSAGSSSDSPIGSISPSLDFDENTGSLVVNNSWNAFGGKFNNSLCRFNWPTTVTAAGATPLMVQPPVDSALINDLLDLTVDEKKKAVVTKAASEGAVTSGRLPVFAQLSNPSSTS